jgi:alkaline phosphatase
VVAAALVVGGALAVAPTAAIAQGDDSRRGATGNMIFIHPDGSDAAIWEAARTYWRGPDATLNWDELPVTVNYRGHAADDLTTSSNGGATTHAFGFKVDAPDSFGTDSGAEDVLAGDAAVPRTINALSGYPGSWLREAANAGLPVGVVNDGDVAEPGTAAFLTEVTERSDASALEIARQLVQGRPGFDAADVDPVVIMGGGEDLFFPTGTPICTPEQLGATRSGPVPTTPASCVVHRPAGDTIDADGPAATGGLRTDGLNLAQAAVDEGYTLVRTRAEFDRLRDTVAADRRLARSVKVLALFADEDIFNDETEESLIARGLVDPSVPAEAKETNLVLYGSEPGTPGYRPPTAPEMAAVATTVLDAHSRAARKPFATVWEVEGTDNFANNDNAIGTLLEARYSDEMIGVARGYLAQNRRTTILTAADGNAGGLQLDSLNIDEPLPPTVGRGAPINPTTSATPPVTAALDGRYGADTAPFVAEPDQFGQRLAFGVAWAGTGDYAGGVVTRAEGQRAPAVADLYRRFENQDVYRIAYLTLFNRLLPFPEGRVAPTRAEGEGAATTAPGTTAPGTTPDAPAPGPTAPDTTAPGTTAPETTAPETTAPETTAPDPITPDPAAPDPAAPGAPTGG